MPDYATSRCPAARYVLIARPPATAGNPMAAALGPSAVRQLARLPIGLPTCYFGFAAEFHEHDASTRVACLFGSLLRHAYLYAACGTHVRPPIKMKTNNSVTNQIIVLITYK